jgi:hypothetical protein
MYVSFKQALERLEQISEKSTTNKKDCKQFYKQVAKALQVSMQVLLLDNSNEVECFNLMR